MAEDQDLPTDAPAPIAEIEHGPSKFEQFMDRNHKKLVVVGIILTTAIAGTYLYSEIGKGREKEAGGAMVEALMQEDPAAASAQLKAVITENAGKRAATTAEIFLAQSQWEAGETDSAISTLERFISSHPEHGALGAAMLKLANYKLANGDEEAAKQSFENIINTPAASYAAPHSLLVLGDLAAAEGDKEKATEYYERFRTDYPAANFSTGSFDLIGQRLELLEFEAPNTYTPEPEEEEESAKPKIPAPPSPAGQADAKPDKAKPDTGESAKPEADEAQEPEADDKSPADEADEADAENAVGE